MNELVEVENECISHNFSLFATFLVKIIKIGGNLAKFWQKSICTVFLRHDVYGIYCKNLSTKESVNRLFANPKDLQNVIRDMAWCW